MNNEANTENKMTKSDNAARIESILNVFEAQPEPAKYTDRTPTETITDMRRATAYLTKK